ncbi:MAG: MFS transporter, partial [Pseudomonadota bacterium]
MTIPPPPRRKHGKNAFMFVIVTVALDLMGFGIIVPVMPELLKQVTELSAEEVVAWGGALTATFAIFNFAAMPTIGNLSDRFGRRPVLLVSIATLAIDFVIMGLANTLWLLFLGRALSGLSSATYSTANAYIADVTEPENRGAAFGMVGAAFGIGFIIGPAIGAAFSLIDVRAPFFAAAALAGINFIYGYFFLPESLQPEERRPFEWKRANPFGAFQHFRKLPHVVWFILAVGIFALAHSVYPATWNFHGDIRYGWQAWEIGLSLTVVGIGSALVQGGLTGWLIKRIGAIRTALFGYVINVVSFTAFAFAGLGWIAYLVIPISALGGVVGPAVNTIMSNVTPKNAQGELHGASASIQALA